MGGWEVVGGASELLSGWWHLIGFLYSYKLYTPHLLRGWADLAGSEPLSLSSLAPHRLLVFRCLRWWCWWPWPGDPGWCRPLTWACVTRGRGEARCTSCSSISAEDTESLLLLVAGPSSLLILSVSEFLRIGDRRLAPSDERSETTQCELISGKWVTAHTNFRLESHSDKVLEELYR